MRNVALTLRSYLMRLLEVEHAILPISRCGGSPISKIRLHREFIANTRTIVNRVLWKRCLAVEAVTVWPIPEGALMKT